VEAHVNVIATEQLAALGLLIAFLFGITCGVVYGAVRGSRRGALLAPASDDLLRSDARVILGVFTRDGNGYPQGLLRGNDQASGDSREDHGSESPGQELDR
jgi:hypothetical protein